MGRRVIPLWVIMILALSWFVLDLIDIAYLHWFSGFLTPERALDRLFDCIWLSLGAYVIGGKRVDPV